MASPSNAEPFTKVLDTLSLSPYVAASIIEHGKRRTVASGYLLGMKTADSIQVTNFFPYTPEEKISHSAISKWNEVTRSFSTNTSIIGWYSACCLMNPNGTRNENFFSWVKLPGTLFMGSDKEGEVGRNALHLHCELPSVDNVAGDNVERPKISWKAFFTLVKRTVVMSENNTPTALPAVVNLKELKVSISANGHESTNVVLNHVRNQALFKGEVPYPSSSLLNLDSLAFQFSSKRSSAAESLLGLQQQLSNLVEGRVQPAGSSDLSASEAKQNIEELRKEIRQLTETENAHAASRDDVVTQRMKDALMIKCLVTLIKKSVTQIDFLSSQYPDAHFANHNTNNHSGNNNGPQWREQQQRGGPNFRDFSGLMNRT